MSLALHINGMDSDLWQAHLAAQWHDSPVEIWPAITDPNAVEYAVTWRHQAGSLGHYRNLRAIFSLGAGVDHIFADPQLPDVPVVRVVDGDLTGRMSEWVVMHCLMHMRQQRMYDWQQSERIWASDPLQPAAQDVRVGIMGLGVLGQDAGHKLKTIGFNVAGWARRPRQLSGIETYAGAGELDAFLARTDILVCLLPLTPETRGILNASLFEKLARDGAVPGPVLLNAGRGQLQVEADILESLESGVLRAAVLDVFEQEPLPQESELWHHPAVTISPHNAAISNPQAIAAFIAGQIKAFQAGAPLTHVVDRARQY
ncbi:MAG: glyoxylate/hydroxypyruvate reductase A [Hyphomicrobiales bacterium]|nr:glyoxylate/hydroxypyruvate reductase A [Hyphomicrobiales bacterium]MDE2116243.1 glyoxylate/hydroxypyruvate reductase A [Hyphomicrobiales bacterium]